MIVNRAYVSSIQASLFEEGPVGSEAMKCLFLGIKQLFKIEY